LILGLSIMNNYGKMCSECRGYSTNPLGIMITLKPIKAIGSNTQNCISSLRETDSYYMIQETIGRLYRSCFWSSTTSQFW